MVVLLSGMKWPRGDPPAAFDFREQKRKERGKVTRAPCVRKTRGREPSRGDDYDDYGCVSVVEHRDWLPQFGGGVKVVERGVEVDRALPDS
jgi:hypothetical protein